MVTQTNHQITKYAAENIWHGDLFMNGKNLHGKNHTGWFSDHHSRNSTIITSSGQVKESQYFIPTYNWTLTPIPNWTCSVVTISPFDAQLPSTWQTNCANLSTRLQSPTRKGCWLQSSSVYPHDEDLKDAWSQNLTVHKHSNFFRRDELRRNLVSDYKLFEQTLLNTCATCVPFDSP